GHSVDVQRLCGERGRFPYTARRSAINAAAVFSVAARRDIFGSSSTPIWSWFAREFPACQARRSGSTMHHTVFSDTTYCADVPARLSHSHDTMPSGFCSVGRPHQWQVIPAIFRLRAFWFGEVYLVMYL